MKFLLKAIIVTTVLMGQTAIAGKVEVEYYTMPAESKLPFSEAVRVGHMLYLSGQIGFDSATGKLVEGGRAQIENGTLALTAKGFLMADEITAQLMVG